MIAVRKQWILRAMDDDSKVKKLAEEVPCSEAMARVYLSRGIDNGERARETGNIFLMETEDAFLLPDVCRAAKRLVAAISRGETIGVLGGSDTGSCCATAILILGLEELGATVVHLVVNRLSHAFGLERQHLDDLRSSGASLIVIADCGPGACDSVEYVRSGGIDLIITDHGDPCPLRLPDAVAVVSPKRMEGQYPDRHLSGAGVAYQLLLAICRMEQEYHERIVDLNAFVAIGTVADKAAMRGENLSLVQFGCLSIAGTQMSDSQMPGLRALVKRVPNGRIDRNCVEHFLVPLIDAGWRMGEPELALDIFLETRDEEAETAADRLYQLHSDMRESELKSLNAALETLERSGVSQGVCFVHGEFSPGTTSFVASRLEWRFSLPCFVTTELGNGLVRGSAVGTDVLATLQSEDIRPLLLNLEGRSDAAEYEVALDDLPILRNRLQDRLGSRASAATILIDAILEPEEIDGQTLEAVNILEPFGLDNPSPVFLTTGLKVHHTFVCGEPSEPVWIFFERPDGDGLIPGVIYDNSIGKLANEHFLGSHDGGEIDLVDVVYTINRHPVAKRLGSYLQVTVLDIRSQVGQAYAIPQFYGPMGL